MCAAGLLKYVGVFNEILPCYFTIYNLYIGIKAHLKLSSSRYSKSSLLSQSHIMSTFLHPALNIDWVVLDFFNKIHISRSL